MAVEKTKFLSPSQTENKQRANSRMHRTSVSCALLCQSSSVVTPGALPASTPTAALVRGRMLWGAPLQHPWERYVKVADGHVTTPTSTHVLRRSVLLKETSRSKSHFLTVSYARTPLKGTHLLQ